MGRYLWRRRSRRAAAGRTETWNVGYDAPEFLPGPHGAPTVPDDRHPQADPGRFRDWADAQASMENILRQYIAWPKASAEDRARAQALLADLRQTPPGSEWRHKVGTRAFWIALEYRDDEAA